MLYPPMESNTKAYRPRMEVLFDSACEVFFRELIDRKCSHVRSFDFRFLKYASRERKNGRVPFIDPFATNPCRQVYGKSKLIVNKLVS